MNQDELKAVFDKQASSYDQQWTRMAPISNGLYFLVETIFSELPPDARILCVGVGTGKELIYLAQRFPQFRFTAVEPSGAMLDVCRQSAEKEGIASRCTFHEGYLDSLPAQRQAQRPTQSDKETHDAATCFLVSQFILDRADRVGFFQQIANQLKPGGILVNSDLSSDKTPAEYEAILALWQKVMTGTSGSPEGLNQLRAAYDKNVGVLPPTEVASIIASGGFDEPGQFFQAGLIHAWFAKRGTGPTAQIS